MNKQLNVKKKCRSLRLFEYEIYLDICLHILYNKNTAKMPRSSPRTKTIFVFANMKG